MENIISFSITVFFFWNILVLLRSYHKLKVSITFVKRVYIPERYILFHSKKENIISFCPFVDFSILLIVFQTGESDVMD